ncbi:MAG: exonuclease domain-containing protein [Clostridia bacterium]|nr:exonuclease domain-containing protein [Clostridia bacterium]
MEYVILDLEWDSVYFTPEKRFINQILQIGAVRLDSDFNTKSVFSATVCSAISKKVTSRFAKLTGITSEIMREGIPFEEAVDAYNRFAEGAQITMTWSNSDLYTILENEELLLKDKVKFIFNKYLDLQKLVQSDLALKGYESKNQISLEAAAELSGIDTEGFELHTALDDCRVCAELLRKSYNEQRFNSLIKDTSSPDFYARLKFKPYSISDINDKQIDRAQLDFLCPECGGVTKRISRWKYRNRWFVSDFQCKKCRFKFNGRVAFKKTYDDLQVRRKVCEFRTKKRKTKDDMQPLSETVQS